MPPSARQALIEAVPDTLMRAIVDDNRSRPSSSSMLPSDPDHRRRSSVAIERPLAPPPGLKIIDQMCDVADELDRRERERKLRK